MHEAPPGFMNCVFDEQLVLTVDVDGEVGVPA